MPIVSVYMTVKNGSKWIRDAVSSVRQQTLEDWELVVVDDGSTDSTLETLLKLQALDQRIRVIPTEGIGRGAALNLAISNCRCDWLANLDADDLAHPDRLKIMYRIAQNHPEFALFSSGTIILEDGKEIQWPVLKIENETLHDVSKLLAFYNPINHSSVFLLRSAVTSVRGYSEELKSQLDYDLWVRLLGKGYRLANANYALAAKRCHSGQSFESRNHLVYVFNSTKAQKKAIKILRAGFPAWACLIGRTTWALLPRGLRIKIRLLASSVHLNFDRSCQKHTKIVY